MSSEIIKFDLFDNTSEKFIIINPTKQQIAFFPKEESQAFQGASYDNSGNRITGWENDPLTETENNDTKAFINGMRVTGNPTFDNSKIQFTGDVNVVNNLLQNYKYDGILDVNSSHTATDYIGAVNINIPCLIDEVFADFKFVSESSNEFANLYTDNDTNERISYLLNGIQRIRIPINVFNTVLTDSAAIEENGGDDIIKNYGKYFLAITPKYIESNVVSIESKEHYPYRFFGENAIDDSNYTDGELHVKPNKKRRTVYKLDKSDFMNTNWNFENNPRQSGRLYNSIVEIWDSNKTQLKQTKIMTENRFNFLDVNGNFECVLQPDIFGYDVDSQDISVGDILRIYPRETYFDQILIDISYKNEQLEVHNLISFLTNDSVRDMTTGIIEVYDDKGFTIDDNGSFNGTVVRTYQIFQKDKFEARKTIKK